MNQKVTRVLPLVVALLLLVAAVFYIYDKAQAFGQRPLKGPEEQVMPTTVTVVEVSPGRYSATVTGYGEAVAHYTLALNAQVSGRVHAVDAAFEAGNRIEKGEILVELENSSYLQALASAKSTLAEAKVTLLEEERQGEQAMLEWRASGLDGEPDSDLLLRKPQLASAKAAVEEAQFSVDAARYNLEQTRITVPFNALVTERNVSPGSYLQAGGQVASLVSTDKVEVSVSLSMDKWEQLPDLTFMTEDERYPATLISVEGGKQWQGYVARSIKNVDTKSRQRALIIAVDTPFDLSSSLYPGTFLQVSLPGKEIDGLWELPATALSQRGEIWYVGEEGTLSSFAAEPVFSSGDHIYIFPPKERVGSPTKVIVQPLSSYLQGMAVKPMEVSDNV